jgi:hypothetical protein
MVASRLRLPIYKCGVIISLVGAYPIHPLARIGLAP